ncbi:MraY family glycosyltransferase [Iodobacter fluviatilis]|uniref:UDP-N-acetylmuramyl pentapeptide phosphotransferase/UDP-N-acetylglucosamine-1-phosphate transferase n=1 Tax=Iodobacter fluviatilis TaxID=537 RepID=A0A377SVX0_9NEIS|nr:glycosyltransferase [Iodobacter fluviatilis]TCU87987.1 UDP-N-acetylmuramyl pentapeptide phosphotransferase/UDP-N-acetylglucosamine-1-phosphate transferase [Iodobacter fluviatilis]STR45488.1 Undecaprenyl-phosphate alpha-N-acetylglucosaminyl 1-phosphate transferase [Iodobacter fluviatilis]
MLYLILAFLTSVFVTMLVIRFDHLHSHISGDHDLGGVQKFHAHSVPRIGGLSIMMGMLAVLLAGAIKETQWFTQFALLIVASLPAFLGGLIEDLTKKVGVLMRLGLTMLAALLGYFLLGAGIVRLDVPYIDLIMQFTVVSLFFTMFAVAGVANAFNIIDGFNGLSAVVAIMIFAGLAYVSFALGDWFLVIANMGMIGACLGFLLWNYPRGLIFLGDGGAYFVGFMVAELSVLLMARHPSVSIWFPFLLCIYPVFETLFTIYRRKFVKGVSPGLPDGIHLHTLIYRRVVRLQLGEDVARYKVQRNALTAPYLWALSSFAAIPAVIFWESPYVLLGFVLLFIASYILLYKMIVNFKIPQWMVINKDS